jgi:hypothetical protein
MNTEEILAWLAERRDNCIEIAGAKVGVDQAAWIDDAAHFQAAMLAITRDDNGAEPGSAEMTDKCDQGSS